MDIKTALARVVEHIDLSTEDMQAVMRQIMTGQCTDAQIGAFLVGLRMKGESIDEITGAAQVMRELASRVEIDAERLVDTCGTGGDGAHSFNISTASMFVVAAAGAKVAKQVPVGSGMLDVAYNPARSEIYATWRGVERANKAGTGGLAVIDARDYAVKQRIPLPSHPNSLEVSEDGRTLFVTVKAPHDKDHPDYREGALDSLLRIDLERLGEGGE